MERRSRYCANASHLNTRDVTEQPRGTKSKEATARSVWASCPFRVTAGLHEPNHARSQAQLRRGDLRSSQRRMWPSSLFLSSSWRCFECCWTSRGRLCAHGSDGFENPGTSPGEEEAHGREQAARVSGTVESGIASSFYLGCLARPGERLSDGRASIELATLKIPSSRVVRSLETPAGVGNAKR